MVIRNKSLVAIVILVSIFLILIIIFNKNITLLIDPRQITPISILYPVKISREFLQSKFIFGNEDSTHWNLTLADKRLTEAEILKNHGFLNLAKSQSRKASKNLENSWYYLNSLRDKTDINFLEEKYKELSSRLALLDK